MSLIHKYGQSIEVPVDSQPFQTLDNLELAILYGHLSLVKDVANWMTVTLFMVLGGVI